jgi:hypothetical protein
MSNTERPQGAPRYLLPPLSLEVRLASTSRKVYDLDIFLRSGDHCVLHRAVVGTYDHFDSLPVVVEDSLFRWVRYAVELEHHRRHNRDRDHDRQAPEVPAWPIPGSVGPHIGTDQPQLPLS